MERGTRIKKDLDNSFTNNFSLYLICNKKNDINILTKGKFVLTFTGQYF